MNHTGRFHMVSLWNFTVRDGLLGFCWYHDHYWFKKKKKTKKRAAPKSTVFASPVLTSHGVSTFEAGQMQCLVATDVAARGLHVKHLFGNPAITRIRKIAVELVAQKLILFWDVGSNSSNPEDVLLFFCCLKGNDLEIARCSTLWSVVSSGLLPGTCPRHNGYIHHRYWIIFLLQGKPRLFCCGTFANLLAKPKSAIQWRKDLPDDLRRYVVNYDFPSNLEWPGLAETTN